MPNVAPSNNADLTLRGDINGLLWGDKWGSTALTFSFPTSASNYEYAANQGQIENFRALNATQQQAVKDVLGLYASVCGLTFTKVNGGAGELRFGEATRVKYDAAGPLHQPGGGGTAEAVPPDPRPADPLGYPAHAHGDVWFSGDNPKYRDEIALGEEGFWTGFMHEIGHALGLKHGHVTQADHGITFPKLAGDRDSFEYSVMTYRQFVGDPLTDGDTAVHRPTTLMMADIAALQYLYGANFNHNGGNTTYTWNRISGQLSIDGAAQPDAAGNYILMTVWDGGGDDTYDFSLFSTDLDVNLNPGQWSVLDTNGTALRANLGTAHFARGNIANAHRFQGDDRSLIENATGGFGDDTVRGNSTTNALRGNGGDDELIGASGDDVLAGGSGDDRLEGGLGADSLDGGAGSDSALYRDATGAISADLAIGGIGGDAVGDSYTSIENLFGTLFDDTLYGTDTANRLGGGFGGNDHLIGRGGDDNLNGNTGDDVLEGGTGADVMNGGEDVDVAIYSSAQSGVVVDLVGGGSVGEAAGDILSAIESIRGSNFDDTLGGDSGENGLEGLAGNDRLTGFAGDDTLDGGAGVDTISGGKGRDDLTGDSGGDRFKFNSIADSGFFAAQRDVIRDFEAGTDKIDVSAIDASASQAGNNVFVFVGSTAFSAEGEVRAIQFATDTILQFNTIGTAVSEMTIALASFNASLITAADFAL